jgi:SAM-dependent methyltransferase
MNAYRGTEGTRPYAGAAWYYAEYRPRVSKAFIALLAEQLSWSRTHRVLDLGAGPAHLSLLVAPLVAEVVAIEPEPDMLAEGERRARAVAANNITFVHASSDDLPRLRSTLGMFRAALMGSSFHWMVEKDRVLQDLSVMIDRDAGAVAFISTGSVSVPDRLRVAAQTVREILARHLAGIPHGPHPSGRHDPFEEILARSPFPHVEAIERVYEVRVRPTIDSLIGAEYSMSHVLTRLGDRRRGFEQEVLAALAEFEGVGEVVLTRRDEALIGRR